MTQISRTNKRSVKKSTPKLIEPVVEVKREPELSYEELQAKAKKLGLKASGSAKALKERIAAA